MAERLDAFLAHRGLGTRSTVRGFIRSGRVRVAGAVCRDQGVHVDGLPVEVDGELMEVGADGATLLVHKPVGHACSHDEDEAPLIGDLVPEGLRHLALNSAGRLDRDTSGLIILTSDGALIHSLTNPKRHVLKRYRIAYAGRLSAHAVARCAKGILLEGDDRPTLPARLEIDEPGADDLGRATMHLAEGRYHQVRRMFTALGGEVIHLHRDRIGALDLPGDLAAGATRALSGDERALLFASPDGG